MADPTRRKGAEEERERNLFREGLSTLWDFVEDSSHDPDLCFTDVGVFDRLEPAQKLGMLELVGTALHDKDVPCPELTCAERGHVHRGVPRRSTIDRDGN